MRATGGGQQEKSEGCAERVQVRAGSCAAPRYARAETEAPGEEMLTGPSRMKPSDTT